MRLLRTVGEVRSYLEEACREGRTIGLVPTMGALHAGHLSLVHGSVSRCDVTVVSVFVNPTQFGPNEDFEAYPRDIEADAALLEAAGVDVLFAPSAEAMYPAGDVTRVDPGPLGTVWCGASRPGHFVGVATVVTKLLGIVRPDFAFFGEKDYQQLKVIERVVSDLDIATHVVGCPIVREADGLALSSRNAYLTPAERSSALVLSRALRRAQRMADEGETDAELLTAVMRDEAASEPGVALEYAAIVDARTLECVKMVEGSCRALIAARVGTTRLIDNVAIQSPGHPAAG